jgi:hypothetical protein
MKRLKFMLPLILPALLAGCGTEAEVEEFRARWIRLTHTPVEEARTGTATAVEAETTVSEDIEDIRLFLYYRPEGGSQQVEEMKELEDGRYFGLIPSHRRGTLIEYYVEARAGTDLAVRVPAEENAPAFTFYYKGVPGRALLISHIVLMFVSLFLFLIAGYLSVRALKARKDSLVIPRLALLGAVLFFVSGFPLGMAVAYQTYGTPWSGFPLGTDITDNKSLAIVIYWAAATFFYRGSAWRRDPSSDLLPIRSVPYVYLAGVILTVALFLIPH